MRFLEIECYAKVNLFLEVGEKSANGLHEIRSVMQNVSLADCMRLEKATAGFTLTADEPALVRENIIEAAYESICAEAGRELPVSIDLKKRIPVRAGMGGGSSDGAAALRGLNALFDLGIGRDRLTALAVGLGSDVPFFMEGGAAIVEGTGERVTPTIGLPKGFLILMAKPPVSLSTTVMYRHLDEAGYIGHALYLAMKSALRSRDLTNIEASLFNRFEDLVEAEAPSVAALKDTFIRAGARKPMMSGSGPAVFSIFDDRLKAEAARHLIGLYYKECHLLEPVSGAMRVADFR